MQFIRNESWWIYVPNTEAHKKQLYVYYKSNEQIIFPRRKAPQIV